MKATNAVLIAADGGQYNEGGENIAMECAVCAALNREHNRECETEAAATLKQRARLSSHAPEPSPSEQEPLDTVILGSRKRQAHIAIQLHGHLEAEHAGEDGPEAGVRQATSG